MTVLHGSRGHICCMPVDMDGLDIETHKNDLSVRRAEYVYDYLSAGGDPMANDEEPKGGDQDIKLVVTRNPKKVK
jgi:hypothetical protein